MITHEHPQPFIPASVPPFLVLTSTSRYSRVPQTPCLPRHRMYTLYDIGSLPRVCRVGQPRRRGMWAWNVLGRRCDILQHNPGGQVHEQACKCRHGHPRVQPAGLLLSRGLSKHLGRDPRFCCCQLQLQNSYKAPMPRWNFRVDDKCDICGSLYELHGWILQ